MKSLAKNHTPTNMLHNIKHAAQQQTCCTNTHQQTCCTTAKVNPFHQAIQQAPPSSLNSGNTSLL
jgi:hypothetical protein